MGAAALSWRARARLLFPALVGPCRIMAIGFMAGCGTGVIGMRTVGDGQQCGGNPFDGKDRPGVFNPAIRISFWFRGAGLEGARQTASLVLL